MSERFHARTKRDIAQTRAGGRAARRVTVGRHGVITAEEARRRAALIVARIKAGEEAIPEPMAAKPVEGPSVGALAVGHTQVETTARYAHLAEASVKESAVRVADSIAGDLLARYPGAGSVAG